MKYIITENQKDKMIYDYMSWLFNGIKPSKTIFFNVEYHNSENKWIMDWIPNNRTLIFNGNYIEYIEKMFGLLPDDTIYYIQNWVKNNLDINPHIVLKQYRHEF